MRENPYQHEREELREILLQFENLKSGRNHSFLEEEAFEKIIDYFDDKDDLSQALQAAEIGIQQFPYSSVLLIKKADLLIATRHYSGALDVLKQAELLDSSDINLYILKTDALLALDKQEKAVEILENALEHFEGDERIELLFELADVYDDYEEFDKVFDCLQLILRQDMNNEEALYKICFWADFTGRNEESIRLHQSIIDEYPYNDLAWFNLGTAYQGLKLYEKAIDAYQFAITIDEKMDYSYRNMGDAYIRLRKYKEAIEALEKVIELSRPEDVIHEAIGYCYDRLKNFAQARFHYKKASHLNPDDSRLYYKIALTYINEQHWESAVKQLNAALKINRMQPEYNLALGHCMVKLENYKAAIEHYTNVIQTRPKSARGWMAMIECLYHAELFEEALEYISIGSEQTHNKPVFYFYKSAVLFALGKSKEALNVLEAGMSKSARLIKKLIGINPKLLQNQQVVELISRYKRSKSL